MGATSRLLLGFIFTRTATLFYDLYVAVGWNNIFGQADAVLLAGGQRFGVGSTPEIFNTGL